MIHLNFRQGTISELRVIELACLAPATRSLIFRRLGSLDAVCLMTTFARLHIVVLGSQMQRFLMRRLAHTGQIRMSSTSMTPMEDTIRTKITEALNPSVLEIRNDSHLHSHHKAMVGNTSRETHFAVNIVSEAFKSKMQPARHRMVYNLLDDELKRDGGIHALQLRTKTPEEEEKQKARTVGAV